MRLVSIFLFASLTGSVAFAEDAKPADSRPEVAKPRIAFRVVRVLPETRQALLFDKVRGTHVLAELGGTIDGFTVEAIDADEVTLSSAAGTEIVLSAPDQSWRHRRDIDSKSPAAADPQPVDPYAPDAAIRTVEAPDAIRTAEAPATAPAAVPVPAAVPAAVPVPVPATVPVPVPVPATAPEATTATTTDSAAASPDSPILLPRPVLTSSLSNFSQLASSIRATFTPTGLRIDAISPDSLFSKVGLHSSDTILSVDNVALHSLDDAASLYARASTVHHIAIQIIRAGKPQTLHVMIQ